MMYAVSYALFEVRVCLNHHSAPRAVHIDRSFNVRRVRLHARLILLSRYKWNLLVTAFTIRRGVHSGAGFPLGRRLRLY